MCPAVVSSRNRIKQFSPDFPSLLFQQHSWWDTHKPRWLSSRWCSCRGKPWSGDDDGNDDHQAMMIFALILSSLCPGTPTHHASGHSSGFNSASPRPRCATVHLFPITTIIPFSYLDNRRYASSLSWNLNIDCQEIDHFYSLSPVPSPTKLAQPMAQVEKTFKHEYILISEAQPNR